jgi:hypothetical protein
MISAQRLLLLELGPSSKSQVDIQCEGYRQIESVLLHIMRDGGHLYLFPDGHMPPICDHKKIH